MDIRCADNLYDSFVVYQTRLIDQFDGMAKEYRFRTINANQPVQDVFEDLKKQVKAFIKRQEHRSLKP
jgi:dTMP kinase